MEKETKLLVGGIAIAGIGFFIPLYFGMVWLALFIALVTVVIVMARLVSLSEEKFDSKISYRIIYGLAVVIISFNALAFARDYANRNFQKNTLLEIRNTIDTGITKSDVQEKMVYVLGQYYQHDRESVVATFRELMPEHLGEEGVYISDHDLNRAEDKSSDSGPNEDDNINYFYEIDKEEDEVKVIAVLEVSSGKDPEYENYDGQQGRREMEFTLNKEGVSHEVLN